MDNKYLRQLGVFQVTVKDVKKTEWKGKESMVAVLEADDGRLIDAKYGLPLNDISKKQVAKILKVAGVEKFSDLKGKKLAALVAPSEYKDKVYWNASNFWDIIWLNGETMDAGLDTSSEDDIQF